MSTSTNITNTLNPINQTPIATDEISMRNNSHPTRTPVKRVKFWTRLSQGRTEEWVLVEGDDLSQVPLKAWKAWNKTFWDAKMDGKLRPLDEMDAYQRGCRAMVKAAENPPELQRASLSTYLVSVASTTLLKFRAREVAPARATYRALFDGCRLVEDDATAFHGEDRSDREWSGRAPGSLNVQAFVEALPALDHVARANSRRLAACCVHTTLALLDEDARRGLTAFLQADGIWHDAARLYGDLSLPGYIFRFRHVWAPAFRKACLWRW